MRPLLSVLFDASSDTVCYQLEEILGTNQYRFDIPLGAEPKDETAVNDDLDDASPENIERLRDKADALIAREKKKLDSLCDKLSSPKAALI